MIDQRQPLLNQWAGAIDKAARVGALSGDKPIVIKEIGTIAGPRAGALELDAGFDAGRSRLRFTALADQLARLDDAEANPPHSLKGAALAEWKRAIDECRAMLKSLALKIAS